MKLVILVDNREKSISHIEKYFQDKLINYKFVTLLSGDYSIEVNGISLEDNIYIERKNSLDELCNNFCDGRKRFKREFERSQGIPYLMIEDATYTDIIFHNYRSQMHPKALLGSLKDFESNYHIRTSYISKKAAGNFIYYTLRAYAKKYIKTLEDEKSEM